MADEHALTRAQQDVVRVMSAQRQQVLAQHDAAMAEYQSLLVHKLGLEGDWTLAGSMDNIKLVRVKEKEAEPSA